MILKRGREITVILLIALCIFLIFINSAVAADASADANASALEKKASVCINESKDIMQLMLDDGFHVLSINDSLRQAESIFVSQTVLKEKKKPYDFSLVVSYCEGIAQIREDALVARDDYNSLTKFYNDSVVAGMDTSSIDSIISDLQENIDVERYTENKPLIDKAYTEITKVKSSYTAINLFYQSTAKGIKSFFIAKNTLVSIPALNFEPKNWQVLLGVVVLLAIALFIYRIRIMKSMLITKLERLQNRKKTIKELIMQTQKDYFQYGKIPEGEYNIKTKRFAELIRDIDRQIPLLQEDIARLSGGTKSLKELDAQKNEEKPVKKSYEAPARHIKVAKHKIHYKVQHHHKIPKHKKIIKSKKKR